MERPLYFARAATIASLLTTASLTAEAQNTVTIDASTTIAAPGPSSYVPQFASNPAGRTLSLNSRYLTLDSRPWLPVMGEFHFSRVSPDRWEEQLLKMKSAGVDIVSTYVFWIHHEEVEGQWDWTGQRDLHRFLALCQKHGLYAVVRVGPWAHGEARNGGLPDWLLAKALHTRRDDPVYLAAVDKFYAQIAAQLTGLYWKDGGPIVGIQIENEYSQRGPGAGEQHLRTLKALAQQHGMNVPFYTVTGWDNAVFPRGDFLQVFGGYPDAPWDDGLHDLPPQEVYAFRFNTRASANMGAIGATATSNAETPATYDFPFLTAEVGGGIEDTYHRRPVISADDVAAMMPVLLGSGANLYGSYMFQGGTNPEGKLTTLQESLATHYPNDLPVKSYDFQAPLGEFGDERLSLRKLKVYNYFLQDFGDRLAPMLTFAPTTLPAGPRDLGPVRTAVRADGAGGFLFFNNYVRGPLHAAPVMPARPGFQAVIQLSGPQGTKAALRIPSQPITLPSGAYGIWPFGLHLGSVQLEFATAELFAHTHSTAGDTFFFVQTKGVPADFALHLDAGAKPGTSTAAPANGPIALRNQQPSIEPLLISQAADGTRTRLVLLTQQQAEQAWKVQAADGEHLLLTSADVFTDGPATFLESQDRPRVSYTLVPAILRNNQPYSGGSVNLRTPLPDLTVTQTKPPGQAPPVRSVTLPGRRPRTVAAAPDEAAFTAAAATWDLKLAPSAWKGFHPSLQAGLHDLRIEVRYDGDVARLSVGGHLLDDNFYNGQPWQVGLADWRDSIPGRELQLAILPRRADAPVFLEASSHPPLKGAVQAISLNVLRLVPQYLFHLDFTAGYDRPQKPR